MSLIFITLCYFSILNSATSYVLLAANIDDFRSIAKKFPIKIAKDIIRMVQDPIAPKKHYESSQEIYDKRNPEQRYQSYDEDSDRPNHRVRADNNDHQSKYNLSLDELVEKVKERLQSELTQMAATANQQSRSDPIRSKLKQNKPANLQQRYKMQSRHDDEDRQTTKEDHVRQVETKLQNNKYVADIFIAQPSKLKPKQPQDEIRIKPKELTEKKADEIKSQEEDTIEAITHMYVQQVIRQEAKPKHHIQQQKDYETTMPQHSQRPQKYHKQKHHTQDRTTPEYKNNDLPQNSDESQQKNLEDQQVILKPKLISVPKHKKLLKDRTTTDDMTTEDASPNNKLIMATEGTKSKNEPLFEGLDLNEKDGYEDYVTPKRDDDFDVSAPRKGFNKKPVTENSKSEGPNSRGDLDYKKEGPNIREGRYRENKREGANSKEKVSHNVKKHRGKYISRNINKNKPKAIVTTADRQEVDATETSADATVRPYPEQILSRELYADETLPTVSEEPKARTAHITFKDDDLEFLTDATTSHGKRKKKNKPKLATVMLKRDFYKLSSPNYLEKMPIVAEKYKFDEPIPELDREPENLKPVGNPPASINGKVRLT